MIQFSWFVNFQEEKNDVRHKRIIVLWIWKYFTSALHQQLNVFYRTSADTLWKVNVPWSNFLFSNFKLGLDFATE